MLRGTIHGRVLQERLEATVHRREKRKGLELWREVLNDPGAGLIASDPEVQAEQRSPPIFMRDPPSRLPSDVVAEPIDVGVQQAHGLCMPVCH